MKVKLVKKLTDKHSLVGKKGYSKANSEADVVERKRYPGGYQKLNKAEKSLGKHEVMGKVVGKRIDVEKRFKSNAKEIALHDEIEVKKMKRKK